MILDNVYTFQRLLGMGLYGNDHKNTITWDVTSSLSGRIHVSEESPISIFKVENSIFIISFQKHYV